MERAFATLAVALSAAGSVLADQAQFRSGTDVVEVHATVKLKDGTIAHDLTRDDFELFEDGKRRDIVVFSASVQPLSVVLVLDRSGSTDFAFSNIRKAAQEFVGRLLPQDRASISTLNWDCQPFTDDPRALQSALRTQLPADVGSPIWSATDRAMSMLSSESSRRIVLLLSDGSDNQERAFIGGSRTPPAPPGSPCEFAAPARSVTLNDVVKRAEREAIMVYTVSVGTVIVNGSHSTSDDLALLAKQSGAAYQRLVEYSALTSAFKSIADELHLQYLLGFAPASDGKRHKIEVRVKRPGVMVQARQAYVAVQAK